MECQKVGLLIVVNYFPFYGFIQVALKSRASAWTLVSMMDVGYLR